MTTKTWGRNMGCLAIDPDQAGLVAGYDMVPRSDGTIEDKSGNGNHGTINGPAFEFTEIGPSMRFAANSEVITTLYTDAPLEFSLCGWYNLRSTGQNNNSRLFRKGPTVFELMTNNSNTDPLLRYENGSGAQDYIITGGYKQNLENLICITYSSGVIKYYLDGELLDTVNDTIVLDSSALLIGGTGGANAVDGNVGVFKFYERALSASEISAEYQAGAKAINWKSDYGVTESVAAEATPGELSNSPARIISGTHKIATDTINGRTCKVIECVTAGVVAIPTAYFFGNDTQAAHGSFEWWMYKGSGANTTILGLIANQNTSVSDAGFNGYVFRFSSGQRVQFMRVTGGSNTVLHFTDSAFVSIATWYKIGVTASAEGIFTTYLNGDLLDVSGGGGTNPVTDTTYTTSKYTVLDLDAGDKVAWAAPNGDCAITKYQGVV